MNFSSAGTFDPGGHALTLTWQFGDGPSSSLANPTHTYASAGTRTITLGVTDNYGRSASKSLTITVH